jgi:hypothetical protein
MGMHAFASEQAAEEFFRKNEVRPICANTRTLQDMQQRSGSRSKHFPFFCESEHPDRANIERVGAPR